MIVTAWIDAIDLDLFNRLRKRLFPTDLNYLSAHVTLFHHIPATVRQDFIDFCRGFSAETPPLSLQVGPPFSLGKGVAYPVTNSQLGSIRERARAAFADQLTSQDDRPWNKPHLTVQNKVTPETAKRTLRELSSDFAPLSITAKGLEFHRYDGGPWKLLERMPFRG